MSHVSNNLHDKTMMCDLCLYQCKLNYFESGLCGRIYNNGISLDLIFPKKIYYVRNLPIEALHFYHFWPGNRVSLIMVNGDTLKRFPFVESTSFDVRDQRTITSLASSILNDHSVKLFFLGGLEPLIYLINLEDLKDTLVEYKQKRGKILITESFFLVEPKHLRDALSLFDAFLLNILFIRNCESQLIPCPNPPRVREYVKVLDLHETHFEINIILVEEITKLKFVDPILDILSVMDNSVPIHISRSRFFMKKRRVVSTKTLEKLRKTIKSSGFRYVYIDDLFISDKNKTPLSTQGDYFITHHGLWIKLRKQETIMPTEDIVRGQIIETYPSQEDFSTE